MILIDIQVSGSRSMVKPILHMLGQGGISVLQTSIFGFLLLASFINTCIFSLGNKVQEYFIKHTVSLGFVVIWMLAASYKHFGFHRLHSCLLSWCDGLQVPSVDWFKASKCCKKWHPIIKRDCFKFIEEKLWPTCLEHGSSQYPSLLTNPLSNYSSGGKQLHQGTKW